MDNLKSKGIWEGKEREEEKNGELREKAGGETKEEKKRDRERQTDRGVTDVTFLQEEFGKNTDIESAVA